MKIIRPLIKLGLGGGAIYLAANQNLFGSQNESVTAVNKITEYVPGLQEYLDKIPSVKMSKEDVITYWNSGVKITFAALAHLPQDSKDNVQKGFQYVKEEIKNQLKTTGKQ